MNNLKKYGWPAFILLAFIFAGVAMSFNKAEKSAEDDFYASTMYQYTWTKDTITDAANDTLYLPSSLRPVNSDFLACVSVTRTNISGTTNLAVKLEESAYPYTGSTPPTAGWASALKVGGSAAATAATTATTENLAIPNTYGLSYRIVVDGTGTQSSSYVIRIVMKKKT